MELLESTKHMKQKIGFLLLLLLWSAMVVAQGIKGTIKTNEGETLPFASIYVKEVGTGSSSNLEGYYELRLNPGTYQVVYQYMGYTTVERIIEIDNGFVEANIELTPRVIQLATVTVTDKEEDPSYTIMRKAIVKAHYHLVQYDNYSAEVYMKGTGQVTKVPWLFKKTLKEEGIDAGNVYTSESVSKIYFERPNTFREKVISVRASGQDNGNADPNAYINSSFYMPGVAQGVSPLSPRAFSYYKFEYQGSFMERGYEINKIKVIPRSKGDDVFEGEIYIREDYWNIHSLDLKTSRMGFKVRIQQIFAPITGEIWMPVTQQYEISGSFLGLAGKYSYLASLSDYEVTENEDLDATVMLIDEKIEPAPEEIEAIKSKEVGEGIKKVFEEDKKVSRKQFRKLMRAYEKQERKEQEERNLVSDYSYKVDSLAARKDSSYWAARRPVPLTAKEIKGYKREDSTYFAEKARAKADSARLKNGEKFKLIHLLRGSYYKVGNRLRFDYPGFLTNFGFNTVEGWNLDLTGTFLWRKDTTLRMRITPFIRYGFAGKQLYGKIETRFGMGKAEQRGNFWVSGGHYIEQFNPNAITYSFNSWYTLLDEINYMRLYEKTFARATFVKRFKYRYVIQAGAEWASRNELFNNTGYSFINWKNRELRPNLPLNHEVNPGGFRHAKAFKTLVSMSARPWVKFGRYNGRLYPINNSFPEFRLTYRRGWGGILGSKVDYNHLELGAKAQFRLGVRAKIDFDAEAGKFFGNPELEFMDFKHFPGNRLALAPLNVVGGFRMLDYYRYSTARQYASIFTHIRFRKLLFTQLPALRFSGIKENFFVNYLNTPNANHYTEVGYTIDNIFRILRLEFVQSFQGGKAREFGLRLGVASIFGDRR